MKYLLILQADTRALDDLTEAERASVRRGHDEFRRTTEEAGELVSTQALADPTTSTLTFSRPVTVRTLPWARSVMAQVPEDDSRSG